MKETLEHSGRNCNWLRDTKTCKKLWEATCQRSYQKMWILKEEEVIVFRGYPSVLRKMPQAKKNLPQKFQPMYRLLAVKKENPASSVTDERSFLSTGVRKQGLDPMQGEPHGSNLAASKSSNLWLFYLTYLLYRMYFKWEWVGWRYWGCKYDGRDGAQMHDKRRNSNPYYLFVLARDF